MKGRFHIELYPREYLRRHRALIRRRSPPVSRMITSCIPISDC